MTADSKFPIILSELGWANLFSVCLLVCAHHTLALKAEASMQNRIPCNLQESQQCFLASTLVFHVRSTL